MKVDNTLASTVNSSKSKSTRAERAPRNDRGNNTVDDSVELGLQESPLRAGAMAGHAEALATVEGLDFHKASHAHLISPDASQKLLSLI
jgi:hypothetical protein